MSKTYTHITEIQAALDKLRFLYHAKREICIDEIPQLFLFQFNTFITGKTIVPKNNSLYIYYADYKFFYEKINGIKANNSSN
jgi:hypothetical protein